MLKLLLIASLIAISSQQRFSARRPPTNCRWGRWRYDSMCERISRGNYKMLQKRSIAISASSGGRRCSGSSSRHVSCTESQFIATSILKAASHILKSGSKKRCLADFYDSKGVRRMVGNKCKSSRSRGKRGVDSWGAPNLPKDRDVLFLVDESGSVGSSNFNKFMDFAAAMTDLFSGNIDIGQFKTRVAVMTFDKTQRHKVDFDDYFVKNPLVNYMKNNIHYTSGSTSTGTCIVDALKKTRTNTFTQARGARVNANGDSNWGVEKLVIMLTDGCSNCKKVNLAQLLQNEGIQFNAKKYSFVTITVGDNCLGMFQNLDIGSPCYTTYSASGFGQIEDWTQAYKNFKAWGLLMNEWKIGDSC